MAPRKTSSSAPDGPLRIAKEVFDTPVEDEMRDSFLAYSLSVITSRAIPDVRDGLKPVQRRILYTMHDMGVRPTTPFVKSARIVGSCMGRYHPHGDSAIYEALVRQAQDFAMRVKLVDGHGNFGSHDDPAAASRYCVTADTLIRRADGATLPIGELAAEAGVGPNSEADVDLQLLGRDHETVRADRIFHSGDHPTVTLRTDAGLTLTGTTNHPILIEGPDGAEWKLLGQVTPGTKVLAARDPQRGRLTGSPDRDAHRAGRVFAAQVAGRRSPERDRLAGTRHEDVRFVSDCVPASVWRSGRAVKAAFAHGFLSEAAVFTPRPAPHLLVSCGRLARVAADLQLLLLELGALSYQSDTDARGHLNLHISGDDLARLVHNLGPIAGAFPSAAAASSTEGEPLPAVTVTEVVDSGVRPVFSVRVLTDDHAFVAGGFVNHNTEARMSHASADLLAEIDEDTVDFRPNYDGKETEPTVLPARLPNLLLNGTTGIAVGMATNIPPHNLSELQAACQLLLTTPDATLDDVMGVVKGPDFPTGGVIVDAGGIRQAYETGRGAFKIRAKVSVGDVSARRRGITITELPYNIGPERFIEDCKKLVNGKQLDGISNVMDLSDRKHGLKIVVEVKTGFNPDAVLAELFKRTCLETGYSMNAVVLVNGEPRTLGLVKMLQLFLEHRLEVVERRSKYRLRRAEERAHIVEGLLKALGNIDAVVKIIKAADDTEQARKNLMVKFKLSEVQASHILEMPLRRLVGLEIRKLEEELAELQATIVDLRDILANEQRRRDIVSDELSDAVARHADPRRSRIIGADAAVIEVASVEIPDEPCRVTLSTTGILGRGPLPDGKGKKAANGSHDLLVSDVAATTHAQLRAVTNTGRILRVGTSEVPEVAGRGRGAPAVEIFDLDKGERLVALVAPAVVDEDRTLFLATAKGVIKRVPADQLDPKVPSVVIGLKDGDEVVAAFGVSDDDEVILVASDSQLLRTAVSSVRPQGRAAGGVAGMRLSEGSQVVAAGRVTPDAVLVALADSGTVKVAAVAEYPAKGRGTGGVRSMRFRKGESAVVAAWVGDQQVAGAAGTGSPVSLAQVPQVRRDAPGEPVGDSSALTTLGALRN